MSNRRTSVAISTIALALILIGCGGYSPEEIRYGTDQCDYCKMTIADQSFGSELITQKGKVLKYDSIECLAAAGMTPAGKLQRVHSRWVTDYKKPGQFLDANTAWIVASERQKSPMGVGLLAAASESVAQQLIDEFGGRIVGWSEVKEIVAADWKLEQ